MKKILSPHYILCSLLLIVLLLFHRSDNAWLQWLQFKCFDFYQQVEPRRPDPLKMAAEVAIVDIDEKALRQVGQWPWPRTALAKLVDALTDDQVAAIGFDAVFPEEDRTSPHMLLSEHPEIPAAARQALQSLPSNEEVLVASMQRSGKVVMGEAGINEATPETKLTIKGTPGILSRDSNTLVLPLLGKYDGLVANRPQLDAAARGIGLFSTRPDADGIIRRVALVERIGETQLFPSLALEMLRVALGGGDAYLLKGYKDGRPGLESILLKTPDPKINFEIPTDPQGRVYVHFARYPTAQPPLYISAADVLNGSPEIKKKLAGKLVVIGTSAAGLKDLRQTPINPALPGVEVHAQVLETILSGTHLTRPIEAVMIEFGLILLGGILMIILVPRLNAVWTFLLTAVLIAGLIATAWHFYISRHQLLDAAYPSLSLFLLFIALSYLNYMREEKGRKQVRNAFSHYVSPALLEQIANHPEKLALGGETKNITILFSDIRGFTTISERFNAQELTRFINKFLTPMTNVILQHEGTIDKYMGDAIMAFWNAPLDVEHHAEKACRAALKMQEAVKALNLKLQEDAMKEKGTTNRRHYTAPINIGIGLNTGDCCVGNMGSDQRFDYSALGDDVNLASRLEGQSKTYGVDIVLGANTVKQLPKNTFAIIELDLIQVKGKTEPATIYALLGDEGWLKDTNFQQLSNEAQAMLNAYRERNWNEAERLARRLPQRIPSLQSLTDLYLERIEGFRNSPPPKDWNGVYVAKSK